MANRYSKSLLLAILFIGQIFVSNARAQQDKTLMDIFEPQNKIEKNKTSKSGEELAYEFYEKCISSPDYFVSEKTQKKYCSCKAAKISESLSPKEISALEEDTKLGKAARDKMRINAESVCMLPAVKSYTVGICMKDPNFKTIVMGKRAICSCIAGYLETFTKQNIPGIIIKAATAEPLSLDALSFFLRSIDYDLIYRNNKDRCYTQTVYSEANSNQ